MAAPSTPRARAKIQGLIRHNPPQGQRLLGVRLDDQVVVTPDPEVSST